MLVGSAELAKWSEMVKYFNEQYCILWNVMDEKTELHVLFLKFHAY